MIIDNDPFVDPFEEFNDTTDGYRPRVTSAALAGSENRLRTMTLDELSVLPDPEWLIEGVLPAESFAVVYGAPGSTKSFWALDAACAIATGHHLHGSPTKQGKVVLAVGEGLRGMKWRIESWKLAHPTANHSLLNDNLLIIPQNVRLLDLVESEKLLNTVRWFAGQGGLRLFILDTWARAMVGGDENSAKDAGTAIDVCEQVKATTGATALVVHHTGADGTRERGSTALRGAADTQMMMERDDKSGVVKLSCSKQKDAERFEDRYFVLSPFGHSAALMPHQPRFGDVQPRKFERPRAGGGGFF